MTKYNWKIKFTSALAKGTCVGVVHAEAEHAAETDIRHHFNTDSMTVGLDIDTLPIWVAKNG